MDTLLIDDDDESGLLQSSTTFKLRNECSEEELDCTESPNDSFYTAEISNTKRFEPSQQLFFGC